MTNAKYHRCERALARIEARRRRGFTIGLVELDALTWKVARYRQGALRAKNGRGAGLHVSGGTA